MNLIERPGFIGKNKKAKYSEWNKKYGENNWGFVWKWGELLLNFEQACLIYEDAYYKDSFKREGLWKDLFSKAKNFYDNAETNLDSKTNYLIQEAYSTHLQDISVRRVGIRRGWKMKGNRLIQIRGPESEGYLLMPGLIEFHEPNLIEKPDILPWWANSNSAEAFYQDNRWLYTTKENSIN